MSRTGDRMSTKSKIRLQCQRRTKQALRRGQRAHLVSRKQTPEVVLNMAALEKFRVTNIGTKKSIELATEDGWRTAVRYAMDCKLAKSVGKLRIDILQSGIWTDVTPPVQMLEAALGEAVA